MAFAKDLEAVVLGVLQDGGRHGYEIARRIREIDEGALNAREGRLYPLLHRLEEDGLIAGAWIPQEGRPPRKVYTLSAAGRDRLATHRAAWRAYVGAVESALEPLAPPGERGKGEGRPAKEEVRLNG